MFLLEFMQNKNRQFFVGYYLHLVIVLVPKPIFSAYLLISPTLYSFIGGVSIYYIVFYLCTFLYKGVPKMSHPFECLYNKEGARNSHPPYLK